ncbi:hypothetical protein Zmor_010223 [Zophobas morio]|uniref:Uncharacterized protein n=1 Tax=Zophobas morio TaxID=2755281 RepID=A0AA38INH0_9CUCU|nr:hypothetical protein Zmor_010223 [Zophobas morio]
MSLVKSIPAESELSCTYLEKMFRANLLAVNTLNDVDTVSVVKENAFSIIIYIFITFQNFRKKPGTTDKGKKYENMITANIILHMVSTDEVKNFHVSSDDANFGAFDDVVIEMDTDDRIQIKAVQLKHSNNPGNLGIKRLATEKGDFSLLKYFKSFQEIKERPPTMYFVHQP